MIKVIYNKVCGRCVQSEPLTSGMVGQPIHFEYSHDFDGLAVTAVFTDGKNTVDVVNPGNECIIPHEVLTTVGAIVKVGIYAVKGEELVIPTIYANIGTVLKGADPSGDVSANPTLPVWAQTQAMIGNLNDLTTEAKNNLVAAINEAAQTGGGGGGSTSIAMRVDGGYIQYSTDNGKTWVNLIAEADLKGDKGDKGADGTSITISDISESAADGGTNTVTFSDGSALKVKNGSKGSVGADGAPGKDGADGKSAYAYAVEGGYTGTEAEFAAKLAEDMPEALPNPNALTFTGAVTGSYDGSAPMTVNIPEGGGGTGGGYSDYEVLIDETITTDEAGISTISYTELDFSQYNDIVIFFDRAMNKANSTKDLRVIIKMLGYTTIYNHSIANPADSYRSSIFRVLNMGNGNVASFACTANNQYLNPAKLDCYGIFPLNDTYKANRDNGFNLEFNGTYIGTIKLKILAK